MPYHDPYTFLLVLEYCFIFSTFYYLMMSLTIIDQLEFWGWALIAHFLSTFYHKQNVEPLFSFLLFWHSINCKDLKIFSLIISLPFCKGWYFLWFSTFCHYWLYFIFFLEIQPFCFHFPSNHYLSCGRILVELR